MRKRRIHQFLLRSPFLRPSKPKKRQPKTSARSSLDHAPIDTVSYVISLVSTFLFSTEYHLRIDAIISGFMHRHRNTLSRESFLRRCFASSSGGEIAEHSLRPSSLSDEFVPSDFDTHFPDDLRVTCLLPFGSLASTLLFDN